MSNFCRKHGALVTLLLLLVVTQGQAQGYLNRHPFDFKKFNLGFLMGFNYNSYNLKEQINVAEDGVALSRIELTSKPGLNFGIISNFNLGKKHSLRLVPTFSLEDRDFTLFLEDGTTETRKIEASYLNVPLVWQYKTAYYKATRVYVLGGVQWGVNLASNKKVLNNPNLLKIDKQDFSLVLGFGVNLYGERLKLSPEIVYKMGLVDIYDPQPNDRYSGAISSLFSQVLALNVNFE